MSDRPFVIILEGPDGCGKTSIARALFDLDPDTVCMRSGPPKGSAMREYEEKIKLAFKVRNDYGMNVVIDRLHVGEMVYGPLLRKCASICREWFERFENMLGATDIIRAYVTIDDWAQHRERLTSRDGGCPDKLSGVRLDQMPAVRGAYEELIGETWMRVETSAHLPKVLARSIIDGYMRRPVTIGEARKQFERMGSL